MSNFSKLTKNADQEYECGGCVVIGNMFEKRYELDNRQPRELRSIICKFHNNFRELESCAKKGCVTGRVFQRALWMRQISKRQADSLRDSRQQDRVWAKLPPAWGRGTANLSDQTLLEVGIGDPPQERTVATIIYSEARRETYEPLRRIYQQRRH